MDSLQHGCDFFDLPFGYNCKDVPVKMHYAPLPGRFGMELPQTLYEPKTLIRDEQLYSLETSFLEVSQKSAPASFILFGSFGYSQNLPIALLIDSECNQDRYVLYLSAPAPLQTNPIQIYIGMLSLDRPHPPRL